MYNEQILCLWFRLNDVENSLRDRSSQRSRNESIDSVILLDETSTDPLKKRLDASSSLLSSFVDSGPSALKYMFLCFFFSTSWHVGKWNLGLHAIPRLSNE